MYILNKAIIFPSAEEADADGLLAIGGDLSTARLLHAYQNGIFPWYSEGEPLMWWSPDPRMVLVPEEVRISKSMKNIMRKNIFNFSWNQAFEQVIRYCRGPRPGQFRGTWITKEMEEAYLRLHGEGYAFSVEAWKNNDLAGGLYGIKLKNCFCGESMFSHQNNASKAALIFLAEKMRKENIGLIDCQVYTPHLESMGAKMIPRAEYLSMLWEGK